MKWLLFVMVVWSSVASGRGYDSALRNTFWNDLYPDGGWTLYCQERFQPGQRRGMQIEHVYPASWMADHLGCGGRSKCQKTKGPVGELFHKMEADFHNLWPALIQSNQVRKNYKFAELDGERWLNSFCDLEVRGKGKATLVEPSPRARGQIARAHLYMHRTYGLPINHELMLKWDAEYPITDDELRRNRVIEGLQE